jgi:putative transposase
VIRLQGAYWFSARGSRGDSYDNALAETINGFCFYKTDLIHRRAPRKSREAL